MSTKPHLSMRHFIMISTLILLTLFVTQAQNPRPSRAQDITFPSQEVLSHEQLYETGEFIVYFKEGQTPADIEAEVQRRAQQAETVLGRIKNTSENALLSLRGEPKPEEIEAQLESIGDQFDLDIQEPSDVLPNTYAISFNKVDSAQDTQAVIEAYAELPIEHIQPNFTYYLNTIPSDPDFSKQWGHRLIKAPEMWNTHTSAGTVKIAVIDSGIDRNHPDLVKNVVKSVPVAAGCINDGDVVGHGTHVAGVIAATANNAQGIAGVTWDAQIYGYCVVGSKGQGSSLTIAEGIRKAIKDGAQVMNMSFSGPTLSGQDRALNEAVQEALDQNITIVTVAGNCGRIPRGQYPDNPACFWGSDADRYMPGAHPDTISVTSVGPDYEHPEYANVGSSIDIAAPGGNPENGTPSCKPDGSDCIYSTWDRFQTCPSSGTKSPYCALSGTSMAAPHVTALVAMLKAIKPASTPREMLNMINSSGFDLGTQDKDPYFGYGLVNAEKAINRQVTPSPTDITTPTPSIPADCLAARKRGDYNCNGVINIADFELWRQDFMIGKATIVEFEWFRAGFTALFKTIDELTETELN